MVTLEQLALFARNVMYADPLVTSATRDEPILQNGMNRGGRRRVRKRQGVRLRRIRQHGNERHSLARGDDDPVRGPRQLHGRDRIWETETRRDGPCSEIPPPVIR